MAAPSGKQYAVGLRHAQVFELDASGYPAATSTTVYEGYEIVGAKAFDMTTPDARRITHTGNDRMLSQDFLPTLEGASGVLRGSRNDYDVFAILTGTNEATVGEAKVIGYGTDQQGDEPDVGLLLFQQSKDATTKLRRWRGYHVPVANCVLKPSSMNDSPVEYEAQLLPQVAGQHLWGVDFANATEGFTEAQLVESMTDGQPWIAAWKGDAATRGFAFNTDNAPSSAAKIHVVALNGTAQTAGQVTSAVTGVTFVATPGASDIIVAFYEKDA